MQIGFVGLLQLIFITLKLMGYIAWSWLWVLSPLWISFIIAVVIVSIFLILYGLVGTERKLEHWIKK